MVKCFKCHKGMNIFTRKYYFYPGIKKGSFEISDYKIICESCYSKIFEKEKDSDKVLKYVELFTQKKFKEALNTLLSDFHETLAEDWYSKANILLNLKRDEEALKCYDEALFLDTHYIKAWYRKGWLLFTRKDYESSIKCFENVVKLEEAKNKKERFVREDWLLAGIFSCMISWIQYNNSLILEKKGSNEISKITINWIQKCFPYMTNSIALSKDDSDNIKYINIGAPTDLTKFVDFCLENVNKILDIIEPLIVVEFKGKMHNQKRR